MTMRNLNKVWPLLFISVLIMFPTWTSAWAQALTYDLLLKGGHVIDPANHFDAVADVAVDANFSQPADHRRLRYLRELFVGARRPSAGR